ncbi:hypothetical protein KR222_008720 [Zaprionus bogoriensis]|nr:hypothetical protein KR222_008720 [Zaprionus bogoriensis]
MTRCVWYSMLLLSLCLVFSSQITSKRSRSKRFLIFPRQAPTRHQFIAGIGIPADLSFESLTIGHVLKAEFFLPYNASVYRQNPYLPEYKNTQESLNAGNAATDIRQLQGQPTELRWQIYAYVEHMLNRYGYNGRECLLQAICEANVIPFSKDFSVFHELLHLILSPSATRNTNSVHAYEFFMAEKTNGETSNCEIYDCNFKLLEWISEVMRLKIIS